MADNQIVLDAVARASQAAEALEAFLLQGEQGLNRLNAIGEDGLAFDTAKAKLALEGLLRQARALQTQLETEGQLNIRAGAAEEILQGVEAEISKLGAEIDAVSTRASEDLAKTGATVAGVAASASARLTEGFAPLRQLGAEIQADLQPAIQALRELQEQERLAEEEATRLANPFSESLSQIDAALAQTTTRTEQFEQRAATSSRGVAREMASLQIAVEHLREEIQLLNEQGANTGAQEAQLAKIEGAYQRGVAAAGKFRQAQNDANDELRLSTLRAGEVEGQFQSMEQVVGLVAPKLAPLTGTLLGVQAGLSIVQSVLQEIVSSGGEVAEALGADKKTAEDFGRGLERQFSINPIKHVADYLHVFSDDIKGFLANVMEYSELSDSSLARLTNRVLSLGSAARTVEDLGREFLNLDNILKRDGISTAGKDLDQIRAQEERLILSGQTLVQRAQALTVEIQGNSTALRERDAAILAATDYLLKQNAVTVEGGQAWIKVINDQIEAYRRLGLDTRTLEDQRRDLIEAVTKALEKQAAQLKANGVASQEATRHFVDGVNQQLTALDEFGRGNARIEAERARLVDLATQALQRRSVAILQDGRLTAAQSEEFVAEIQREIDQVEKLGQSSEKLKELLKSFQAIQRAAQLDGISVGLRNLREFASEAQRGGRITTEQADQIVAKYRELVQEIAKLPEAERQQYAGRLKEATAYYQKFFELSSTYRDNIRQEAEKLAAWVQSEEELFKRREATIKGFAQTLAEAAKSLPDSPKDKPKQSASDLNVQIRDKQQQLADLESKTFQSPEDRGTIDKLRQEVQGLTSDLRELGGGAQGAGGDFADLGAEGQAAAAKIRQELIGLITTNDDFRKGFRNMPQEFKDAASSLVSGFLSDLDNGLVRSGADVQSFVDRFTGLLQQGGAVSDGVVAQLRAMGGQAQATGVNMSHLFDGLEQSQSQATQSLQSVVNQLLRQLGVSQQYTVVLDQQGNAYVQLAGNAQQAATATTAAAGSVAASAPGTIAAAAANQQLAQSLAGVVSGASATVGAAQAASQAVQQAGAAAATAAPATAASGAAADGASRGYIRASQGAHELSDGTKQFIEAARQAGKVVGDTASQTEQMGAAAQDAGDKVMAGTVEVKNADQATKDLATSVTQQVDAYNQAISASHDMGDAAQGAAQQTQQVGEAASEAGNEITIISQYAGGLKEKYIEIKDGAHEANEGIHKTGEEAQQAGPPVQDLSKGVQGVADSSKQASQSLADGAERLGTFAASAQQAGPAAQEAAKGLEAMKGPVGEVADGLERIGNAGVADELQAVASAAKDGASNAAELKDKVKELADEVDKGTKGLKEWRTELEGAGGDLKTLEPILAKVLKLCQDLAACQAGAAANG